MIMEFFSQIKKTTTWDQDILEHYVLTSLISLDLIRRNQKKIFPSGLPMTKWRKILAMAQEDVVSKTLKKTSFT